MNFLSDIVKEIDNEYAGLVSDGVAAGDTAAYIDTGSYIFNALVSGSIYGGIPSNKITSFGRRVFNWQDFLLLLVLSSIFLTWILTLV